MCGIATKAPYLPAPDQVPAGLRHLLDAPIWIGWLPGKLPATLGGDVGGYTHRNTWQDYHTWKRAIEAQSAVPYAGVGISASAVAACGANVMMIDIDNCIDAATGQIDPRAAWVIEGCQSYAEVSPSGKGIRIIGSAEGWPPGERSRFWSLPGLVEGGAILKGETYRAVMYCTITFAPLEGYAGLWSPIGAMADALPKRQHQGKIDLGRKGELKVNGNPLAPVEIVRETLGFIENSGGESNWNRWNTVGLACWAASEGSDEGLEAWRAWSAKHDLHEVKFTCEDRWDHYFVSPPNRTGYAKLHWLARMDEEKAGRIWRGGVLFAARREKERLEARAAVKASMGTVPGATRTPPPLVGSGPETGQSPPVGDSSTGNSDPSTAQPVDSSGALPVFSDAMLARRMIDTYGGSLRYVAKWGKWMLWKATSKDGGAWREAETLEPVLLAQATCESVAVAIPKIAVGLLSRKTIEATMGLARADARVAARTDQWDTDPWLLNTPDGVLDLRAGGIKAADRNSHMTKITTVTPDFKAECPTWMGFLDRVTGGRKETQDYLGRVAGYCITGLTTEQALFFLYGRGRNGKGTFLNILSWLLGIDQYACHAGPETFTAGKGEQHLTEIARLRGARLVVTAETEEGKAWAESRIKLLTGQDPITARFMGQDHFTFIPLFKLLFAGNHKPRIRSVDPAMAGRMNLIPFEVVIPPEERDQNLMDKLKAEGPAIMAWAVRGCWDWQNHHLAAPAFISSATKDYLDNEDSRKIWLDESCVDFNAALAKGRVTTVNGVPRLARIEKGKDGVERPVGDVVKPTPEEMDTVFTHPEHLFHSWRAWAEKANEYVGNMRSFVEWLRQQGFKDGKDKAGKIVFRNIIIATSMGPVTNTPTSNVIPINARKTET